MGVRQVYVKERSAFTIADFASKIGVDEERASGYIDVLASRGVLRWRFGSERDEFDSESPASFAGKYQFVYVGLVVIEDLIIVVYPKYMDSRRFLGNTLDDAAHKDLQQLFYVLRKSAGSYSDIVSLAEGARKFNDRIAWMLMLMEMYDEHGIYSNYVRIFKNNGTGDISWERTITARQAFIDGETPVYFDLETIASTRDDADFIMRLHKCVLTECSDYMKATGLLRLLSLDEIELSDEKLEDLGGKDYILYRLDQERGTQFVTWKQDVLDLLIHYVEGDESDVSVDEVVCLGSTAFYNVWEKACKIAFGDLLDKRLDRVGIALAGKWADLGNQTMMDIVPSPKWFRFVEGEMRGCNDVATLKPDTVAVWDCSDGKAFVILDAKYYTPRLDAIPQGVPGVEAVVKQVLYQRSYKDFVSDHGFSRVVNAFLVPCEGDGFTLLGHVDFPDIFERVQPPFVDGVDMWLLPARRIWQCYLNGKTLSESELDLLLDAALRC